MNTTLNKNDAGMALITALIFISVALLLLGALLVRNINQTRVTERYQDYKEAMLGVESALAMSVVELERRKDGLTQVETERDGIIGMDTHTPAFDENNSFIWPDPESESIDYESMKVNPTLKFAAYTVPWGTDGRDSNGDGAVDNDEERDTYAVYAMAKQEGTTRRVEAVMAEGNINVWENAIFAGAGQAGGLINGNVSIHGAVHLLGDNLPEGQTAIAAIDLSGTSLIHNNYDGLPATLAARVPPLPQTVFEGETIETMDAVLRVRNGLAGMSGTSEIGQPQQLGNSFKETMDGTFVNDGWTGNSVIDDGDRGDPTAVWSDNGWDNTYDVGDQVPFPRLTDDWRNPGDSTRIEDPDGPGEYYSHQDYFTEVLLADPTNKTDGIHNGSINLAVNGTSFYWNATLGIELTGAAADLAVALPDHDYIKFQISGSDAILTMNGQIRINGDLSFTGQGNSRTVHYSGRAAILAFGDVTIDTNLLSCNNGDKNNTANSFPVNNILGLMASNNMYVGTTAQLQIMGGFYAQNRLVSAKQTTVMGTFVSNYFDMGTNVPDIYQVPILADNLPLGMIGNYPILAMTMVSWREM